MRPGLFIFGITLLCSTLQGQYREAHWMTGQVMDTIHCTRHPEQSYALYIPTNYSYNRTTPVLYIFDPGARGRLPVSLYALVAERYGYVLVCSNNSKNGPVNLMEDAAEAVLTDTRQRLKIDTTHIYVAGFSGGSRFASFLAMKKPFIRGVIACGAGFLQKEKPTGTFSFAYCAIVGKRDMNYSEMTGNKTILDKANTVNKLIFFNGDHEWPEPEKIAEAMDWFRYIELKATNAGKYNDAIETYFRQRCDSMIGMVTRKLYYDASVESNFIKINWPERTQFIDSLLYQKVSSRVYAGRIAGYESWLMEERSLVDSMTIAFRNIENTQYNIWNDVKQESWWKSKKKFFERYAASSNRDKVNEGKRLLNFVEANCSEFAAEYMDLRDYERVILFCKVYNIFSPATPWGYYTMAKAYAFSGNRKQCMKSLKIAIQTGFKRKELLLKEPFVRYEGDAEFKKIAESL